MNRRFYIIAGEVSGDIHGAELVKSMLKINPEINFKGFGGEEMEKAGVDISVGLDKLSIMGFVEVAMNIGTILNNFKIAKREILEFNPEAIILIDFPGFNLRMAKWAKKHNIKVYYFIAPMVWAWGRGRVKNIKKYIDKLFVILPFEKDFFATYGIDTIYVGNPILEKINDFTPDVEFKNKYNIPENKKIIAFFPGSRNSEMSRNIEPVLPIIENNSEKIFLVAAMKNTDPKHLEKLKKYQNIRIIFDCNYDIMKSADAGIIKSGTSSLEASIFKLAHVVVFRGSWISAFIIRNIIKIKFVSLINLILDKLVVAELLQEKFTSQKLESELNKLFDDKYRNQQIHDFKAGISILKQDKKPTEIIAEYILK